MDWKNKLRIKPVDPSKYKWGKFQGQWKLFNEGMQEAFLELYPDMEFFDEVNEDLEGVNLESDS
jgi:hypothetical protein